MTKIPGVDIARHGRPGYKALLHSDGDWMAALMNGTKDSWRAPDRIEKHPYTDELFVLVSGRALMVTGGKGRKPGRIVRTEMEKGVLYNVKRGTWHATPMTRGAKFVIVERKGTNGDGTVLVDLTEAQSAAGKP